MHCVASRCGRALLAATCLWLGFTSAAAEPTAAAKLPPSALARVAVEPFMRVTNNAAGAVELQVAMRKLVPTNGTGPVIWLAGASHIGETNYYTLLQKHLDAQALVLFEGIHGGPNEKVFKAAAEATKEKVPADPTPKKVEPTSELVNQPGQRTSLQKDLAESLGLVFQLEAINYARTNFRNSDLSVNDVRALMDKDPEPATPESPKEKRKNEAFEALLKAMDGKSLFGSLLQAGFKMVGANPKLQAMTKLALIEALGGIRGDLSRMKSLPEDMQRLLEVLIQSRNDAVLKDVRMREQAGEIQKAVGLMLEDVRRLDERVEKLRTHFGQTEKDLRDIETSVDDAKQRLLRAQTLIIRLTENIDAALGYGTQYVAFVSGGPEMPRLEIAPLDVGPVLTKGVWSKRTAVLTSATVPTSLAERVGLPSDTTDVLDVGSPFDYENHGLLY